MNAELVADLKDLLAFRRAGHMGHWEYSEPLNEGDPVNGIRLWREFLQTHPEYYLPRVEAEIAQAASLDLPELVTGSLCLVSLGPGDSQYFIAKELGLTSRFNEIAQAVSCDLEHPYITTSLQAVVRAHPGATLEGKQINFFRPFEVQSEHTVLATMFGGTLFNKGGFVEDGVPIETISARLRNIGDAIGKGYFFVTVDHNQDKEKVERAYRGQGEFARNLVHLFNRDASTGFDHARSGFRVQWHPGSSLLAHYLTLDGTEYHFNNSYKMPEGAFGECVDRAGMRAVYKVSVEGVTGYLLGV